MRTTILSIVRLRTRATSLFFSTLQIYRTELLSFYACVIIVCCSYGFLSLLSDRKGKKQAHIVMLHVYMYPRVYMSPLTSEHVD
jgi:hypothetical protein